MASRHAGVDPNDRPDQARPALRAGHWRSLAMLEATEAVQVTLALYRAELGADIYLRPTSNGLLVISLDASCPRTVGVGGRGSVETRLTSLPPTPEHVHRAVDAYRAKVQAITRESTEERFSLGLVSHALGNGLRLPDSDLLFVCQEWRLPTEVGRLDLLAIDPARRALVIVELKANSTLAVAGQMQAEGYAQLLWHHRSELYPFFERLGAALAGVYGQEQTVSVELDTAAVPGVQVWWPPEPDPTIGRTPPRRPVVESPIGHPSRSGPRNPLDELAAEHQVFVSSDSVFQRRARVLQALWRERHGFPIGEHNGRPLGSRLAMPGAEEHLWNYLSPAIGTLARDEYRSNLTVTERRHRKLIGYPRLFNDLLSSQPMCFNLFGPLTLDLDAATSVGRALWPGRVAEITAVRFEYSPGRWDPRYLDNGTAADVLLEHTTPRGGRGVIAIETKYHEDLEGKASTHKARYEEVARRSEAFLSGAEDALRRQPLQQIWLDHLLALVMREVDGLETALHVLVYPRLNDPVASAAAAYSELLAPGPATFQALTLEDLHHRLDDVLDHVVVEDFADRYLAFDSVGPGVPASTERHLGSHVASTDEVSRQGEPLADDHKVSPVPPLDLG